MLAPTTMSGYAAADVMSKILTAVDLMTAKDVAAGFFRYLPKPTKVEEFMSTLHKALELSKEKMPYSNGMSA